MNKWTIKAITCFTLIQAGCTREFCWETNTCIPFGNEDAGTDAGPDSSISATSCSGTSSSACEVPDGGKPSEPQSEVANCEDDFDCESSFCVDGVCCNTRCDSICAACNVPGAEGTCTAPPSDTACPALQCPGDTECMTFSSDTLTDNCKQLGECRAAATCGVENEPDDQPCSDGDGTCSDGECRVPNKKLLGDTCSDASECGSSNCSATESGEKVCCSAACNGTCEACGTDGVCDSAPLDDARCSIECPSGDPCTTYPEAPLANRCKAFSQCVVAAEYCAPAFASDSTPCDLLSFCDGSGHCEMPDTTVPFVVSFTPGTDAIGVDPTVVIEVQFSEPMDTLSTSGASLSGDSGTISADFSWTGTDRLSIRPTKKLALLGNYSVTLDGALTDATGNSLAQTTLSFKIRDGVWEGSPQLIETDDDGDAVRPQLVVGSNDVVTVIWMQNQEGGATYDLNYNQYVTHWGLASHVETSSNQIVGFDLGGVDSTNSIHSMWWEEDGDSGEIFSSLLSPDGGDWSTPALVYSSELTVGYDSTSNGSGLQLACFVAYDPTAPEGADHSVFVSDTSGGAWSVPVRVASGIGYTWNCKVALDAFDDAMLVWEQDAIVQAIQRPSGQSWSDISNLDAQTSAGALSLSVDSGGIFWAIWRHGDETIQTSHRQSGSSWSAIQTVTSENGGDAQYWARIRGDGSGNAMAVWGEAPGNSSQTVSIQAAYFNGTWSQSSSLSDSTGDSSFPVLEFDALGNALLVWSQPTSDNYYAVARRYVRGGGWGSTHKFSAPTNPISSSSRAAVGLDSVGAATVAWEQKDGIRYNVWALRFE